MEQGTPMMAKDVESTDAIRNEQMSINEAVFSRIGTELDKANRDCEFLDQALSSAQQRRAVLSAAMDVFNAPQQAVPQLR